MSAAGESDSASRRQAILGGAMVAVFIGLLGAAAGIGLAVVTDALSRTDIGGAGWTLRGNGALVVPFSLVPALLAGGWVALARWRVGDDRYGLSGGIAAAGGLAGGALISAGPVLAMAVFGPETLRGGEGVQAALLTTYVLPVLLSFSGGLVLAAALAGLTWPAAITSLFGFALAIVLVVLAPGAFFILGPLLVVPLLFALPALVASRRRAGRPLIGPGWLAGASVALAAGLAAGLIVAQRIQAG